MKNGTCPRCGGDEVYDFAYDRGYRNHRPVSLLKHVPLVEYVCAACGLVESYVKDPAKIELVRARCRRVPPAR